MALLIDRLFVISTYSYILATVVCAHSAVSHSNGPVL